jgi:hypothetical protein
MVLVGLGLGVRADAHIPVVHVFGPEDGWCGFLNQEVDFQEASFYPGDVVVLRPGAYAPCAFTALVTDGPGEFTVLQSLDEDDPARFVWTDDTQGPLLDITGTQLQMFDLVFEDVPAGAVGVRLSNVDNTWMRFGRFSNIAGTGLSIEGDADTVWILDEWVETAAGGTGIELVGDGSVSAIRLRNDVFTGAGTGVRAAAAIEVSDSLFAGDGAGRGIALVGPGDTTSLLSSNAVLDLETGIEASSDVLIRNSVLRAQTAVAIGGGARARVLGNSIVGALELAGASADSEIGDNAGVPAGRGPGNVPCDDPSACWRDADANDFYPAEGSALLGAGQGTVDDALYEDFCESERVEPRTSGAIQWVGDTPWDPIEIDFRDDSQCKLFGSPDALVDLDLPTEPDDPTGCGCRQAPVTAFSFGVFLLGAVVRRRRVRPAAR